MITKQAIERLKNFKAREKRRALPDDFNVYVEHQYNIDALDMAIEALSKHCASSEQADTKLFNRGYWLMPGEVFISHNVLNEVLNTITKSINTEQRKIDSTLVKTVENDEAIRTDDHIADDSKMVDQFRDTTKKTDDVPDIHVGKIPYKKPEIIRCTECKKSWYSGTATINGKSCRIFKCSVWERPVSPFGFCYMAERAK